MFQPVMSPPLFPYQRGPVRIVVDAAAAAIARSFDRIAAPRRNVVSEFLINFAPCMSMLVDLFKPSTVYGPPPRDVGSDEIQELQRQLAAHELRLHSLTELLFGDILKAATDGATSDEAAHNGTAK